MYVSLATHVQTWTKYMSLQLVWLNCEEAFRHIKLQTMMEFWHIYWRSQQKRWPVCQCLQLIFQASLTQGSVPSDWKKANIVPVFKKGDRANPGNYCPIALTSVCSKVMEHIVHSGIIKHLEQHDILSDQQHGFPKNRSCETQLILTVNDRARNVNNLSQIKASLLDFSECLTLVCCRS